MLIVVLAAIIGSILYLQSQKTNPSVGSEDIAEIQLLGTTTREEKAKKYETAKEITTPDGFINTPSASSGQATPISIGEFIGKKVVLVDFWTYSCINCQRTLPYLNAWHKKYSDKGLVIIGLHTPEFQFEHEYKNVLAAVEKFGVEYPVVLDNDFSTWRAYKNRYWPRKYLIDIDGFIVYDHIGEGGYEETEKKIQELLNERMAALNEAGEVPSEIAKPSGVSDNVFLGPRSPEIYFGSLRNARLGSGERGVAGMQKFSQPADAELDTLYLVGSWDIQDEYAKTESADAKIIFRYRAKNVFIVAGAQNPTALKILRDGKPLDEGKGERTEIKKIPIRL